MPELPLYDLWKPVQEAVYVAVGFSLLGFQKAQVRRRELGKLVGEQTSDVRAQLQERLDAAEEHLGGVEAQLDAVFDQLAELLPEQGAELLRQARTAARQSSAQLRGRLSAATRAREDIATCQG